MTNIVNVDRKISEQAFQLIKGTNDLEFLEVAKDYVLDKGFISNSGTVDKPNIQRGYYFDDGYACGDKYNVEDRIWIVLTGHSNRARIYSDEDFKEKFNITIQDTVIEGHNVDKPLVGVYVGEFHHQETTKAFNCLKQNNINYKIRINPEGYTRYLDDIVEIVVHPSIEESTHLCLEQAGIK